MFRPERGVQFQIQRCKPLTLFMKSLPIHDILNVLETVQGDIDEKYTENIKTTRNIAEYHTATQLELNMWGIGSSLENYHNFAFDDL